MPTFATQITIVRLALVPVFCHYAVAYSRSLGSGSPEEMLRWIAVGIYIFCSVCDGVDGWIARKFDQQTRVGAFLDAFADKILLVAALITLCIAEWGLDGWKIPVWFTVLVLLRDAIIWGGICILFKINGRVPIVPHWTGKVCTVCQMLAIGWTMLKPLPISPLWPALVAGVFTVWSGLAYIRQGYRQLPHVVARRAGEG